MATNPGGRKAGACPPHLADEHTGVPEWAMANPRFGAVPIADLTGELLDPLLRKRAGLSVALVQSWEEIVGPRIAASSRPDKISWPRRLSDDDPFEPATLIVACNGIAAMHLQHESGEIIARINTFLGFEAIGRIRIVQKHVEPPAPPRPVPRKLAPEESARVERTVEKVDDPDLRASLERLGRSIIAARKKPRG